MLTGLDFNLTGGLFVEVLLQTDQSALAEQREPAAGGRQGLWASLRRVILPPPGEVEGPKSPHLHLHGDEVILIHPQSHLRRLVIRGHKTCER